MTRKEKVEDIFIKKNRELNKMFFHWTYSQFAYWTSYEVIENAINNQLFFFCESNGTSLFRAFKKYSSGDYEMSSRKFTAKFKEFEIWLNEQAEENLRTFEELEALDIDG